MRDGKRERERSRGRVKALVVARVGLNCERLQPKLGVSESVSFSEDL